MGRLLISWTGWRHRGENSMNRATEPRLRKLEANAPAKRVRLVFSMRSDPVEWDREIAAMIASGRASAGDQFLRMGWLCRASSRERVSTGFLEACTTVPSFLGYRSVAGS